MERAGHARSFLLALVGVLCVSSVLAMDYDCCCSIGGTSFNIVIAPPSVTIECLYQHDYFDSQWYEPYTGYAASVDICAFIPGVCGFCIPTTCGGYNDVYHISHTSQVVTNHPGCAFGNSVSITRTFAYSCGDPKQIITVSDTVPPDLFVPAARNVECVSTNGVAGPEYDINELDNWFGSARATDLCTNPTVTENVIPGTATVCSTSFTRQFVASDGCNTVTKTQAVSFVDTTPPVLLSTTGSYFTYTCDQTTSIANTNNVPTFVDQCDNYNPLNTALASTDVRYNGKCNGDYSIERTWTATDACNNQASFVQIIVVEDPDPPTVLDITGAPVTAGSNQYFEVLCTVPAPPKYLVQDACSAATNQIAYLSYEETTTGMDEFQSRYDVIRSYKAFDDCGNSIEWEIVYNVKLDTVVTLTGDNEITGAVKGSSITIRYSIAGTLCTKGYVAFDIGPAQFVSCSLGTCTANNGGLVYCLVTPGTVPASFSLVIVVPTTYAADTLQIRYSFIGSDPEAHEINNKNVDFTVIIF